MKKITLLAAAFAALLSLSGIKASAEGVKLGDLEITETWARASAGKEGNGAAYLTVTNHGQEADRIVGAKAEIAERVEIHNNLMEDGIMKMRRVDGIDVPAGEGAKLQPGGYHVMFMGLHKPMEEGTTFPLTLIFEKGGEVELVVPVMKIGSHGKMKMDMKH
jgi:hypothetical protein